MCVAGGMAIAQFALGAASAVANYSAQQAQYDAQMQQYKQNIENSRKAAIDKYAAQQDRITEERRKQEAEIRETQSKALRSRATARTAAGEANVSGLSTQALVADYYGRESNYITRLEENYDARRGFFRDEMKATKAQAASRMNSIARPVKPSFAGAAIRIAGLGMKAAASAA